MNETVVKVFGGEVIDSGTEFFLDPGTATSDEIAELFFQLSKLHQMMGGSGVLFSVNDCREIANNRIVCKIQMRQK